MTAAPAVAGSTGGRAPGTRPRRSPTGARTRPASTRCARGGTGRRGRCGPGPLERLHEVAGRARRPRARDEPRREVVPRHRLVVVRVHPHDAAADVGRRQDPRDPRARHEAHRVRRRGPVPPARARVAAHVLDERPPAEHVDRLEAAADPEHRHAALRGRGERGRLERVPAGSIPTDPVGPGVEGRVEVGAAGEEQAVHRRERRTPHVLRRGGVEDERRPVVAPHAVRVELVLPRRDVGLRLVRRDHRRHDDGRSRCLGHRERVPRLAQGGRRRYRPGSTFARRSSTAARSESTGVGPVGSNSSAMSRPSVAVATRSPPSRLA